MSIKGREPESLGVPLYTANQVSQLDKLAIEFDGGQQGKAGYDLMKQAGEAAFGTLLTRWASATQLLILCGKGNNGGDGFVMARLARQHKMDVQLVLLGDVADVKGEAKQAADDAIAEGLEVSAPDQLDWSRSDDTVVVDALLGTGLQSDVSANYEELIEQANNSGLPILAIDVPSGINATTGLKHGTAIMADATVTMIAYKQGLFTAEGPVHAGQVSLAALTVAPEVRESQEANSHLIRWKGFESQTFLAKRQLNAHKGCMAMFL